MKRYDFQSYGDYQALIETEDGAYYLASDADKRIAELERRLEYIWEAIGEEESLDLHSHEKLTIISWFNADGSAK